MMRLLVKPEPFLSEGRYIYFKGKGWTEPFREKVFRVVSHYTTKRDHYIGILPPSYKKELTFKETFEPLNEDTFYQIRVGLKPSTIRMYFAFPAGQLRGRLERSPYDVVNPEDTDLTFLGFFEWRDTPWHEPKFEIYSVKNHTPSLQFYADDYEKLVLHMLINMCKIEEVTGDEKSKVIIEKKYLPVYSAEVFPW